MPIRISAVEQAKHHGRDQLRRLSRELRVARLRNGLTQAEVGRRIGRSAAWVSRVERDRVGVGLDVLVGHAAAVGLRLSVSAYPVNRVPLDAPQRALLAELERRAGGAWTTRYECPMPRPGDLRAADAVLSGPAGRVVVEAETRLVDLQATLRAAHLKARDLGADRTVLLVAATRANRRLLREDVVAGERLNAGSRAALGALAAGRLPAEDSVILLPLRTDGDATTLHGESRARRAGHRARA